MSERINDGGPAFPHHIHEHWGGDGLSITPQHGMSLRDYFAGQALAGMKPPTVYIGKRETEESLRAHASLAYLIADAMIAAREGGKQ